MTDKIIKLADRVKDKDADSSLRYSCSDILKEALDDIESGHRTPTKCVVLFLDDGGPERYNTGWTQAGMKITEILALMDVIKYGMIREQMRGDEG